MTPTGVTGDNLTSLNAHGHKVTAHVLPISYWHGDVKMISVEGEIAVHSPCVWKCLCVCVFPTDLWLSFITKHTIDKLKGDLR